MFGFSKTSRIPAVDNSANRFEQQRQWHLQEKQKYARAKEAMEDDFNARMNAKARHFDVGSKVFLKLLRDHIQGHLETQLPTQSLP